MLKIERSTEGGEVRFVLSGRIEGELLPELEGAIAGETVPATSIGLDLAEVRLVDHAAIRFLVASERAGLRLTNCPTYIREWMAREQNGWTPDPPDES